MTSNTIAPSAFVFHSSSPRLAGTYLSINSVLPLSGLQQWGLLHLPCLHQGAVVSQQTLSRLVCPIGHHDIASEMQQKTPFLAAVILQSCSCWGWLHRKHHFQQFFCCLNNCCYADVALMSLLVKLLWPSVDMPQCINSPYHCSCVFSSFSYIFFFFFRSSGI
jgi:hypothetical protein